MTKKSTTTCAFAVFSAYPQLALAHHAMDGQTPDSLAQGLLSGLAHPVIGLDHLSIVLLLGAVCARLKRPLAPLLGFVSATLLGCALHVQRLDLPRVELVLALSVLGLGAWALFGAARSARFAACAAASGVLHGYAYGESIVGAEATPLAAYLVGFALVQLALAAAMVQFAKRARAAEPARAAAVHLTRARAFPIVAALAVACVALGALALYGQNV
jgi:urease accessory protein